jgi:excisionase family DNA binding protein
MTDAILVNGVTPQQLTETILNGVQNQLEELKKNFTPKEPDDFLTRMEVAKLLKISLTTVHDWMNANILKAYKVGNRTYFSRKEIESTLFSSNSKG